MHVGNSVSTLALWMQRRQFLNASLGIAGRFVNRLNYKNKDLIHRHIIVILLLPLTSNCTLLRCSIPSVKKLYYVGFKSTVYNCFTLRRQYTIHCNAMGITHNDRLVARVTKKFNMALSVYTFTDNQ